MTTTKDQGSHGNPSGELVDTALRAWVRAGWLRDLDLSFANFVSEHSAGAGPLVRLAAALVSHQLGRGHPWLDLARLCRDPIPALAMPANDDTRSADGLSITGRLLPSELIGRIRLDDWLLAIDSCGALSQQVSDAPLVREGSRIYLRRYRAFEKAVDAALSARIEPSSDEVFPAASKVRAAIDFVYREHSAAGTINWQRIACALAMRQRFTVITGGPGTGKTTTVVRLLAALQILALNEGPPPSTPLRIGLAAPTGKAAARLNESITVSVRALDLSELAQGESIRAAIPTDVATLHRLLGARRDGFGFRHNSQHPLALDVLVIDEASMIDLELMAAVCAALPAQARLIVIGDKDQLASVEAGAVLGGLCKRADTAHYLPSTAAWLGEASGETLPAQYIDEAGAPLDQAVVKLRTSYRFGAESGIGQLAAAINAGEPAQALTLLKSATPDLELLRQPASAAIHAPARAYRPYLEAIRRTRPRPDAPPADWDRWAQQILAEFGRYRLLATTRQQETGVDSLNRQLTAQLLSEHRLITYPGEWFEGRPVLVTRNDHDLGLMNGDVGIALTAKWCDSPADAAARLRVAFIDSTDHAVIRWVLPARLRFVETAFVMTVHKAQGSEFEHATLILPAQAQPLLTRELLYTAVTRAKHRFTLIETGSTHECLEHAIASPTERGA